MKKLNIFKRFKLLVCGLIMQGRKALYGFLCIGLLLLATTSCSKKEIKYQDQGVSQNKLKADTISFPYNRDLLWGMCEPLYLRALKGDISVEAEVDIMYQLGVTSVRLWMEVPVLLNSPTQANVQAVAFYKQIINKCQYYGITVIGMSCEWNYLDDYLYNRSLPDRDTNLNSDYMQWMVYTWKPSWNTLAATFPEIKLWEIANETNNDGGLHKLGYSSNNSLVFTYQQKADITTDLMYYSNLGIKQANPQALVVMPGASPVANGSYFGFDNGVIESFISKIYANINSGNWPSTNPRDYFGVASWHPYYVKVGWTTPPVDNQWLAINNQIYNVCQTNGDDGVPVFLTEFGYSDQSVYSNDVWQASSITTALNYIKNDMLYVNAVNVFRLFDSPRDSIWGGANEVYFGLFHINGNVAEGYTVEPKEKGKAYANFIGAGRDIFKYSNGITSGATYKIKNHTSGLVLDGQGADPTTNGVPVVQWSDVSSTNLQWEITLLADGYYKIKNIASGYVLNGNGQTADGAALTQYQDVTSPNVEWQILRLANGYCKIKNHTTGLVVDGRAFTTDGSHAGQRSDVTSPNLEWLIVSP